MNDKQIQKLMKKAARPFDERKKRQEAEDAFKRQKLNKKLDEIKQKIMDVEKQYPNRGYCLCIYNSTTYIIKNNKIISILDPSVKIIETTFEFKEKVEGCSYYLQKESEYLDTQKLLDWVANNYAQIKISMNTLKKGDSPKDALINFSILGSIYERFLREFPDKNILHLREAIIVMDRILQEKFNNTINE